MKVLLFLRQLRRMNFYRNPHVSRGTVFVLANLEEHPNFNLGQLLVVQEVNRTTGEIKMELGLID